MSLHRSVPPDRGRARQAWGIRCRVPRAPRLPPRPCLGRESPAAPSTVRGPALPTLRRLHNEPSSALAAAAPPSSDERRPGGGRRPCAEGVAAQSRRASGLHGSMGLHAPDLGRVDDSVAVGPDRVHEHTVGSSLQLQAWPSRQQGPRRSQLVPRRESSFTSVSVQALKPGYTSFSGRDGLTATDPRRLRVALRRCSLATRRRRGLERGAAF